MKKRVKVHHRVNIFDDEEWRVEGKLHRENGPAIICKNGDKHWYFEGKLHRTDGPAVELSNGGKTWYKHGKLHKEDGPAIDHKDNQQWFLNGKRHNLSGPAVIKYNNYYNRFKKEWWINGERITEWDTHPFYIFAIDYSLPLEYEEWPTNMKALFKLIYT